MERYNRQIILDQIGEAGQKKLLQSSVTIIGCGGLGSIIAPYLAGAGVGKLILVDRDKPHISNLHRQIVFKENETQSKARALGQFISAFNAEVNVAVIEEMLEKKNVSEIIPHSYEGIVVECTDDMVTKYLLNDYCHINKIPLVYGAIHKYEGYVSLFKNESQEDIHLRDIFPEINTEIPNCSEVGVMNTIAGIIGILQAQ